VEIRRGAGAYICGEETALFEAIEGKRGFPRLKPPFPTTHGLFNKPTVINNVETLAAMPDIVLNGGEWLRQWGTEKSSGIKLFCVSGHVKQTGVVEMPFGTSLRHLIEQHCGGFEGTPQAILMGGAAGGFLPPDQLDTPLTFEDLRELEAPLGSGVVKVFNETVDIRQVLLGLARFFEHESCGQCLPCRVGTVQIYKILDRLSRGEGKPGDLDKLEELCHVVKTTSLCGLGQSAPNSVLSGLRYFRPELEASIRGEAAAD
jgi:NADH-quinone oxidoreductase subunit F